MHLKVTPNQYEYNIYKWIREEEKITDMSIKYATV